MALADPTDDRSPRFASRARRFLAAPLSTLSFWSAIALPAVYLPLLIAGVDSQRGLVAFLGLFALHLAALVGGRSYAD
ncbi:MAG: hypothetical protein ABEI39_05340 [Halobacteriales archaeon]